MNESSLYPEGSVYQLPVDITPAVVIPSVYLKSSSQSVVSVTGRRTGPYGGPLEKIGLKEKILIVILSIVLTILISLIASLAIMMCQPKHSLDGATLVYDPSDQSTELRVSAIHSSSRAYARSNHQADLSLQPNKASGREPCVNECWSYAAFQFQSQCISGYCVCKGEFYAESTCLPSVYGCNIERNVTESRAYLTDEAQAIYSCSPRRETRKKTFVLSTYGHHSSPEITVDITTTSSWINQSITLILANYYPTRWKLNLHKGVRIRKIVLVSNDHVTQSSVNLADDSTGPVVRKTSCPVGYGDDRYGGHTVGLLKYVTRHYGPISSFLGVHYANRWQLALSGLSSPNNDTHDSGLDQLL